MKRRSKTFNLNYTWSIKQNTHTRAHTHTFFPFEVYIALFLHSNSLQENKWQKGKYAWMN